MAIYALSGELVFTKSGVGNNINIGDQRNWLEKDSIELRSLMHKAGIRKPALEPDARRRFNGATHLQPTATFQRLSFFLSLIHI